MIVNSAHPSSAASPAPTRNYFSLRRVALCLLPLLVLALWILAFSGLASAGGTATADQPARVSVQIPFEAKGAGVVMLDVSIAVVRKAPSGQLGAAVRFKRPGGSAVEVGRVSLAGGEQSYQFDVSHALGQAAGGSAEVEVSLIDRGGGPAPSGAALSIGRAHIVTR